MKRSDATAGPDSEVLLRATIDALDVALHVVDRELRIVLYNERFERWCRELGVRPPAPGQRPTEAFDFLPPEVLDQYRRVLERGEALYSDDEFDLGRRRVVTQTRKVPVVEAGQVRWVLTLVRDVSAQVHAERELRASEATFRALADNAIDAILRIDREHRHLYANPAFARAVGLRPPDVIGRTSRGVGLPADLCDALEAAVDRVHETSEVQRFEHRMPDGDWVDWLVMPELGQDGAIQAVITAARDITEIQRAEEEKKALQEQLLQAQKMEAVGRLAGGVAHDFNNLLTGIAGNVALALMDLEPGSPVAEALEEVNRAADSAAALTGQLLAFSRKQVIEPRAVDLNQLLRRSHRMLRRLIGEDIDLVLSHAAAPVHVEIDPSQLEQALVNLAVNARDAMPSGGRLELQTAEVTPDEAFCRRHELDGGVYAVLSVSDDGVGMSASVRERLFEPFFTTKEVGKGTGLGLASVYGMIKQNRGAIEVRSAPGQGATFCIYLPWTGAAPPRAAEDTGGAIPRGAESVAVVEDDPSVRQLAVRMLERQGYRVIAFADGEQCLRALREADEAVDLLITDVVMPGITGKELADRVRRLWPGIRVLFSSGYPEDAIAHHGVLDEHIAFIGKPFGPRALARKVREALDGRGGSGG